MSTTNFHRLTGGHRALQAKRRAKRDQIKQVTFDENARREFLTGFHKRKVARAEAARAKAKEKEKQERLNARNDRRRWLREQAVENAAEVEKACGAISDADNDEWQGITCASNQTIPGDCARNEEYEDEETLATVTVVEEFDPGTMANVHPSNIKFSTELNSEPVAIVSSLSHARQGVKNRKIRYESKQARRKERAKRCARRTEKAELAGGKARRHKDTGRKHGHRR